jgi:predicted cation transporter
MELSQLSFVLLTLIILAALFLPFLWHKAEEELEIFLFCLGVLAATASKAWSWSLLGHTLIHPISISLAVLITGILFNKFKDKITSFIENCSRKFGLKKTVFGAIVILSFLSSIITAIIAALILCEVVASLRLNKKDSIKVIIMGCFGIGMGAVLTRIGEPLSVIVIDKLAGEPHYAGFFFLLKLLWPYIIPAILFFAYMATRIKGEQNKTKVRIEKETSKAIIVRAGKIYLFIMALVLFGEGLSPLARATIQKLPPNFLYWANSLSAILDNATLAAAEIVPQMTTAQIEFLLMALIVSGSFLIPGNIPNIICASKFKIKSSDWARRALPLGLGVMFVYFIILNIFA